VDAGRVLVVEDDEAIGRGLETVLAERGFVVQRCSRGGAALVAADADRPDLVLLDLGLPDIDGVEVCRRLRRGSPSLPIVVLTARDAEMDIVLGLNAGADDYIAKPFRLGELLARIGALLRRVGPQDATPVVVGDITLDPAVRAVRRGDREIELRPREFDLLLLLARNAGRVVPRDRILAELWRDHWGGASKTLDMHISTLRRRLGEPGPITTFRGVGYRLDPA
jgi:DNA-binding response OmpR family regulator